MFDWITIDESLLPAVPELESRGISSIIKDKNFQTKDLDCSLDRYKIEENGVLQREEVITVFEENTVEETSLGRRWNPPFTEKEVSRDWIKENFTGAINIYTSIEDPETKDDFWIDYRIIFYDGELKSIKLDNCRVELYTDIKKKKEEWNIYYEKEKNRNSFIWKRSYT